MGEFQAIWSQVGEVWSYELDQVKYIVVSPLDLNSSPTWPCFPYMESVGEVIRYTSMF